MGVGLAIAFIHTADWQLGAPFGFVPGDAGAALRDARFAVVRRIALLAWEKAVDAVLVAGDVFDGNAVSDATVNRALDAMAPFGGPWVLLPGNHDAALAESVWTRLASRSDLPKNIVLATEPRPLPLAEDRLVVLPAPLRRRHESADLTGWFDGALTPEGAIRVGLAHGSIEGLLPEDADVHNPIAADRAARARLDWLALGDWHGTVAINAHTAYSGTPEPDRFKDNEPGAVLLVRIAGVGARPEVERMVTGAYCWHRIEASVYGTDDVRALEDRLRRLAENGAALDRQLVKLTLRGAPDLDTRRALDERLAGWREPRLRWLDVDDTGLLPEPSSDDLDRLGRHGFVGAAALRLRARAADPADPEQGVARLALQMLYLESVRLGDGTGPC